MPEVLGKWCSRLPDDRVNYLSQSSTCTSSELTSEEKEVYAIARVTGWGDDQLL